ncbi:MAG: F0F1 ATP synthase subunit epsilon [Campylobacteraceae bacterium]|jgi:F-type H+-transporting ATPase subunit epsilon|nr:F0F1 ATP synthase subunit epsilon [Campylobacteraceae bacterium]
MELLKLEIVTPEGLIFSGDVKSATFPGTEGEFGVLPRHVSLLTGLNPGVIEIDLSSNKKEMVAIDWGFVKVEEEKTTVLANGAVAICGESESEIATSLESAKKLIESMSGDVNIAIAKVDSMFRKSH